MSITGVHKSTQPSHSIRLSTYLLSHHALSSNTILQVLADHTPPFISEHLELLHRALYVTLQHLLLFVTLILSCPKCYILWFIQVQHIHQPNIVECMPPKKVQFISIPRRFQMNRFSVPYLIFLQASFYFVLELLQLGVFPTQQVHQLSCTAHNLVLYISDIN